MKKFLSLFLASAMLVSAFVGCGSSSSESSKESSESNSGDSSTSDEGDSTEAKDPVVVSLLMAETSVNPYSEDWKIFDIIDEHSGGTLDVTSVPLADFYTKQSLLINTGDLTDISARTWVTAEQGMSGLFYPIDEMEKGMTIFPEWIESHGLRKNIEFTILPDGHYYTMPCASYSQIVKVAGWGAREDVLAANDLEIPATLDDLYEVGSKLKEIYPDSDPLTSTSTDLVMGMIASAYDTFAGYTLINGTRYDYDSERYIFGPTSQNWYDMLSYMNSLYEAGILDPEYSTLEDTAYEAKVVQGDAFFLMNNYSTFVGYNEDGQENNPDFHIIPINPLEGQEGYEGHYAIQGASPWTNGWGIKAGINEREDYQEFLNFMDWFYTDEAELLLSFGIEGEDYTEVNGVLTKIDLDQKDGFADGHLVARLHPDLLLSGWGDDIPVMQAVYDFCAENKAVPPTAPLAPLSTEETEDCKIVGGNLSDYVKTMTETFIFGNEKVEDYWDTYVETCEAKGSVGLIETYNTALDRKLEATGGTNTLDD